MTTPRTSTATLVAGIVACFITVVIACTLVTLFSAADVATFVAPLLGFTGTTLALLAAMAKVNDVDRKVDYLANGGTDAKIRAGIADVVRPELLKDEAAPQLEADRAHREAGPAGSR